MDNFNGTIPTLPSDSGKIVQMMGNGSSSAYLFLFSPREMTAQYRRPYDYKFNDKFGGDLSDLITRNMSGVSSLVDDFMLNSADARTSVLPTATAIPLSSAPFNQCWTFLLVVDNDELVTPFGFSKTHPSRIYYMGWCIDEPVTRKNLSQEYVPNPSAIFQTAHHTVLCSRGNFGPDTGYVATDVMSDYDYAPTSVVTQMHHADQTPYDLNPSKVANEIVTSSLGMDEYANVSPSISVCANPLMTQATPLQVDTSLNDPTRHLGNIVRALSDTVMYTGRTSSTDEIPDEYAGSSLATSQFASMLGSGTPMMISKVDPEKPFSFSELMEEYPNLIYQVILMPNQIGFDATDVGAPTANNVFASMIHNAMPSILAQYGFIEATFRYNSFARPAGTPIFIQNIANPGVFEVMNLASFYPCPQNELMAKWNMCSMYLQHTLFPIIKNSVGDFDLMVNCSVGGSTIVQLNLLDYQNRPGFAECNNLLGGLNTPTVGLHNDLLNNAVQLHNLTEDSKNLQSAWGQW